MGVRLMIEKSSLIYPGVRILLSVTGRLPKVYPRCATRAEAFGSMRAEQLKKLLALFAVKVPSGFSEQPLLNPATPFAAAEALKEAALGLIKGTPGRTLKRKFPLLKGLEVANSLITTGEPLWYRWIPPTSQPPKTLLTGPCDKYFLPGPTGNSYK